MKTMTFQTEPFSCPTCVKKIETAVGGKDGVDSTRVLFNSNKVKVGFDPARISADEIARTITELGYPVVAQK